MLKIDHQRPYQPAHAENVSRVTSRAPRQIRECPAPRFAEPPLRTNDNRTAIQNVHTPIAQTLIAKSSKASRVLLRFEIAALRGKNGVPAQGCCRWTKRVLIERGPSLNAYEYLVEQGQVMPGSTPGSWDSPVARQSAAAKQLWK
jgi:hypothetical protein